MLGIGFQPNHVGCLVVYTINKITKQPNNQTTKQPKQPNNKIKPYPHHVENIVEKYEENMWTASGE